MTRMMNSHVNSSEMQTNNIIINLLLSLPKHQHQQLYSQPSTALAILKLIPNPIPVTNLIYAQKPIPLTTVTSCWSVPETDLKLLFSLHILEKSNGCVMVDETFKRNLHWAVVGGGPIKSFGYRCTKPDSHNITIAFLDTHANQTWEGVLHFLVGTPRPDLKRPPAVMKLLESSGLMANSQSGLVITQKGFQFLLQDVKIQVWAFLLQYYEISATDLGMDPIEVLNFLFQLGSMELGKDYEVDSLTETQKTMLKDLTYLGLIYQRKKKSSRFYPTRLATSLTSATSIEVEEKSAETVDTSDGYIILETNYRVYAYSVSPLQIAVLSLFIDLRARFPNMVVGMITRDKVREAFDKGITAEQIILYLSNHAHPEMKKNDPVLPMTVLDQLQLWQLERNRLTTTAGHLLHQFVRMEEYKEVLEYSKSMKYLLWKDDHKRILIVSKDGKEGIKEFVTRLKRE